MCLPGRRMRQRWEATGAPTQAPEWRDGASRPKISVRDEPIWLESGKSQGCGDRVPTKTMLLGGGAAVATHRHDRRCSGCGRCRIPAATLRGLGRRQLSRA
jgi:hypothetical protein